MAWTKEAIEELYSRVPSVSRPPDIYVLANADIGAERLYSASHHYNAELRTAFEENWHIFGMHQLGTPAIVVAGDALPDTPLHEAIHYTGVKNEAHTRALTAVAMKRAQFNMGFLRRPTRYEEVPVTAQQANQILHSMGLHNPSGQHVELVHLVYVP